MTARRAPLATGAFVVAAGCLMLSGCTVGPDYQRPAVSVPARFAAPPAPAAPDSGRWWQVFRDPQLDGLIERAVAGNPDVELALTRVQEARLKRVVVLGGFLPTLDASAATAIGSGSDLTRGRTPEVLRSGDTSFGDQQVSKIAGIDAVWEVDLFGKGRREVEAATDDAEARQERRRAVLTTVIAEVVRTYFEVRALELRLQIARKNIAGLRRLGDLRMSRPDPSREPGSRDSRSGDDDEDRDGASGKAEKPDREHQQMLDPKSFDLSMAEADLAELVARVSEREQWLSAAETRLAMVVGASSAEIAVAGPPRLPPLPGRLRPGTPVELLRQRPDIREAEREVAAATARIGAATADLFPTVSLAASLGAQGSEQQGPGIAVPAPGPIWSFGPDAYWRVLDFGRLDAVVAIKEMRTRAALVAYRKTIITAVEEVNEAVRQYHQGMLRAQATRVAAAALCHARDIMEGRYRRRETADFKTLLEVQRRCAIDEDTAMLAGEAGFLHYVALHEALGAGWELYDAVPPLPPPQPAAIAAVTRFLSGWRRD